LAKDCKSQKTESEGKNSIQQRKTEAVAVQNWNLEKVVDMLFLGIYIFNF